MKLVDRQTRIYYKKRFFDYPIKAFNALSGLGIIRGSQMCAQLHGRSGLSTPGYLNLRRMGDQQVW